MTGEELKKVPGENERGASGGLDYCPAYHTL